MLPIRAIKGVVFRRRTGTVSYMLGKGVREEYTVVGGGARIEFRSKAVRGVSLAGRGFRRSGGTMVQRRSTLVIPGS